MRLRFDRTDGIEGDTTVRDLNCYNWPFNPRQANDNRRSNTTSSTAKPKKLHDNTTPSPRYKIADQYHDHNLKKLISNLVRNLRKHNRTQLSEN